KVVSRNGWKCHLNHGLLTLNSAQTSLTTRNSLLSRALQVLTDVLDYPDACGSLTASLNLLLRVVGVVPTGSLSTEGDPWLYFYEDFLAAYDPKLRKDTGVYYTPVEIVRAQVRLVDDLLVGRLGKKMGFAAKDVFTLDPAVGTGTYLLGVISQTLTRARETQGPGAVPGVADVLAEQISGFELMTGPYAVAELRVSRALGDQGATLSHEGGPHIYLSDTLESPHAKPLQLPLYLRPISDQRAKALEVKSQTPVLVCLGNPPYDRHEAGSATNKARTGGWVRWGDSGDARKPILEAFISPAKASGQSVHIKNLYNLYVYFWRWALWKVFEHESSGGPGVVSFISASSYLSGPAFCGMREHLRRLCDNVWILDLGGEGHAEPREENVFAIRTPVAIAVAVRTGPKDMARPARVLYARIQGSREAKLAALDGVKCFDSVDWDVCPNDWQAPFRPTTVSQHESAQQGISREPSSGIYHHWPLLTDLMPWQHSGTQLKRTWPIAPDEDTLRRRWRALLAAEDRRIAFRETNDRKIDGTYESAIAPGHDPTPIALLAEDSIVPRLQRYAHRSFDRQYIISDVRLMSRPRPALWRSYGAHQVYLSSLLTDKLAGGPALTASAFVPDLHHFSGRGAKDTIPLYRSADTSDPNVLPSLLEELARRFETGVTPEDFVAYLYGTLAHPAYVATFSKQLLARELRVPITKDHNLFEKARRVGARLLWLHTYGERFVPTGMSPRQVQPGSSRCVVAVPSGSESYPDYYRYDPDTQTLHVGSGQFQPVPPEVFEFEVSGMRVVKSWIGYRIKRSERRKSSPLNEICPNSWTSAFTTELLELLWVLEATVATYPKQSVLLAEILAGDYYLARDLPPVPPEARRPRALTIAQGLAFGAQ
ncbi:MAG: N-6 DNA methylase, partial [Bryobacterales bacterium]|nr:N-6 DNA methylase [Bryobacterales bacterium]